MTASAGDEAAIVMLPRIVRIGGWLLVGVAMLWLVMSLTYPFGWDQGLFAWVGDAIVRGGMPYRDAWDFKGPLVYYTFALSQALFGVNLWGIRVLDAVLLGLAAVSVFRAASALADRRSAPWAALTFVLWYASQSYWHTAQPDGWAAMLLAVTVAPLLVRKEPVLLPHWVAGAGIGAASLLKPHYAVFLLLPIIHAVAAGAPRRIAPAIAAAFAGWIVPVAAVAAYFAARGALDDLVDVHLRYAALYVAHSPGSGVRRLAEFFLSSRVVTVALPAIAYGAVILVRERKAAGLLLIAWMALVIASVAAQNRFYAYHWLPLLPVATLLGTIGLWRLRANAPTLAALTLGVVLVQCAAPVVLEETRFLAWSAGRMSQAEYYDAYGEPGDDMKAVAWLRQTGEPGEVLVFGWHSAVAWLSGRRTVSRFGYSLPFFLGDESEARARYRAEFLGAIRAAPPRYMIVGAQAEDILGRTAGIEDFPEFADVLRRDYRERVRLGRITIFEELR